MRRWITIAAVALLWGCAGAKPRPDSAKKVPSQTVTLDPMLIRPTGKGKTETLDVGELFDRAYREFSDRRYEDAATDYQSIIRYFHDSRFYLPSLYNAGLAYERLDRWDEAAKAYQKIVDEFPDNEETTDAYYRLAGALEHLQKWDDIVQLMTDVLLRPNITTFDRVEAYVRRSNAMLQLGQYQQAVSGFRNALSINQRAPTEQQLADNSYFIVECYFGIGRAYHYMDDAIPLVLPPERMGEDLKKKAQLFMTAQANYLRALEKHHPQWSMAAGYMIGRLYEDFYRDIFQAEIPPGLTDEQLSLYFEELRKQIRPLMERAVQVYEKNLSLSERIVHHGKNEWIKETTKHLKRLKAYLNDPETQKRAERFVLAGRSLEMMWQPVGIAEDGVWIALRKAQRRVKPKPPATTGKPPADKPAAPSPKGAKAPESDGRSGSTPSPGN